MPVYCDTHVHCYDFDQLPTLLDHALANFLKNGANEQKVLFLTDGTPDRTWRKLKPLASEGYQVGEWALTYIEDTQFIHATKNGFEVLLAPARQINSAARLEYLLLGCDHEVEEGMEDRALLSEFSSRFVVINPWGVGKWLGGRGKLVSNLCAEMGEIFMLGDNGGRPSFWRWVPQFKSSKYKPLNGSDPLPIDGELDRVATYGIALPFQSSQLTLSMLLGELKLGRHKNYGKLMSFTRFLKGRIAMARR